MLTIEIYQRQIKLLREENEELRETVRQLREEAAPARVLPDGLPHMTPLEEKTLIAIWSRRGFVAKDVIYSDLYGDESEVDLKIVDVMVCRLRKKLTAPTHPKIVTAWAKGYAIDRGDLGNQVTHVAGEVSQLIAETLAA